MTSRKRKDSAAALAIAVGACCFWSLPQAVAQDAPKKVSFTAAQADRGKEEYNQSCEDCHGANLDDGEFGGAPLRGSHFDTNWGGQTADALFGYLSSAMPPDRPGRLSPQAYADLTAFILRRNGYEAGAQELPPDLEKLSQFILEK
jgi:mono/diheme cytochrome c family protein